MERVRDRLGTELSWEGERFEARVRYRLDRVLRDVVLITTAVSCLAVAVGVLVDARALLVGALFCIVGHQGGQLWALVRTVRGHVRHLDRGLVAEGGVLRIDDRLVDGATELVASSTDDGRPHRLVVLDGGRPTVVTTLGRPDAARAIDALARALHRAPRPPTVTEQRAWRMPLRSTGFLASAGMLGYVLLVGLYAAILTMQIDDPAGARALAMIGGPIAVLSPLPYWALAARLALGVSKGLSNRL